MIIFFQTNKQTSKRIFLSIAIKTENKINGQIVELNENEILYRIEFCVLFVVSFNQEREKNIQKLTTNDYFIV